MFHNPLFAIDFYKVDHRNQYPEGTTEIYSNFTPRFKKKTHSLWDGYDNQVVVFGIQHFVKDYLMDLFKYGFFGMNKKQVVDEYKMLIEVVKQNDTLQLSYFF